MAQAHAEDEHDPLQQQHVTHPPQNDPAEGITNMQQDLHGNQIALPDSFVAIHEVPHSRLVHHSLLLCAMHSYVWGRMLFKLSCCSLAASTHTLHTCEGCDACVSFFACCTLTASSPSPLQLLQLYHQRRCWHILAVCPLQGGPCSMPSLCQLANDSAVCRTCSSLTTQMLSLLIMTAQHQMCALWQNQFSR